jgi:heptosyltransferase-2/heptosyltransferase-3
MQLAHTQQLAPTAFKRILVIKPDHLGDLLLATPALTALRSALPHAQITGLVGPWSAAIWRDHPSLDRLLELPFPGFERTAPRRTFTQRLQLYATLARYAALLRPMRFDAALLLRDDHWWGAWLAYLAGIPTRVGHAHPRVAPLLTRRVAYDPDAHVSQQSLAVVAALTGTAPQRPPLSFQPPPADRAWAQQWYSSQIAPHEQLAIIHPGTGGPTKHWLPERWAVVGDALAARPGWRVLLTGGPGETALVAAIIAAMQRPALNLAGQTSPNQLTALLAHAALVLGVDSGPLHLAVSQGVPTVHLYGPSDEQRFGPWGDPARQIVVQSAVDCRPCGVFAACPRGYATPICMSEIGTAAVLIAAQQALMRTADT